MTTFLTKSHYGPCSNIWQMNTSIKTKTNEQYFAVLMFRIQHKNKKS